MDVGFLFGFITHIGYMIIAHAELAKEVPEGSPSAKYHWDRVAAYGAVHDKFKASTVEPI